MDEQTWLACEDVQALIGHLHETNFHRKKAGRRKLKLLGCACARTVWPALSPACRAFVEAAELAADGRLSQAGFDERYQAMQAAYETAPDTRRIGSGYGLVWTLVGNRFVEAMASVAASYVGLELAHHARREAHDAGHSEVQIGHAVSHAVEEGRRQAVELAREIFGNPFRAAQARKWPADVRGLAQACFDDASHYPLLADALADLGEDEAAEHCRRTWHVKGCHVVDRILGKA